mmetsp:Transcript_13467/g.42373  ORF Transcript_13467/g.42373 Transcript_13467/m.42373 type:complete len:339 (-) Transcript_13467:92-1108(-)
MLCAVNRPSHRCHCAVSRLPPVRCRRQSRRRRGRGVAVLLEEGFARLPEREQRALATIGASPAGALRLVDELGRLLERKAKAIGFDPVLLDVARRVAHERRRHEGVAPWELARRSQVREEMPLGRPRQAVRMRGPKSVGALNKVVEQPARNHEEAVKVRGVRLLHHHHHPPRRHRHRRRHAIKEGHVGPRPNHPGVRQVARALMLHGGVEAAIDPHVLQVAGEAAATIALLHVHLADLGASHLLARAVARLGQVGLHRLQISEHDLQARIVAFDGVKTVWSSLVSSDGSERSGERSGRGACCARGGRARLRRSRGRLSPRRWLCTRPPQVHRPRIGHV